MILVLTLLCRDEATSSNSMLRFQIEQGVDWIIATDNGSVDGSLAILQRRTPRRCDHLLIQEPSTPSVQRCGWRGWRGWRQHGGGLGDQQHPD